MLEPLLSSPLGIAKPGFSASKSAKTSGWRRRASLSISPSRTPEYLSRSAHRRERFGRPPRRFAVHGENRSCTSRLMDIVRISGPQTPPAHVLAETADCRIAPCSGERRWPPSLRVTDNQETRTLSLAGFHSMAPEARRSRSTNAAISRAAGRHRDWYRSSDSARVRSRGSRRSAPRIPEHDADAYFASKLATK